MSLIVTGITETFSDSSDGVMINVAVLLEQIESVLSM